MAAGKDMSVANRGERIHRMSTSSTIETHQGETHQGDRGGLRAMRSTTRRLGAMCVALGVLLGVAGLTAGPASAQTTSGGATADEGSVASGTATAVNGSTASGDAVAIDGSVSSGCATAADGSTASGAPCPTTTIEKTTTTKRGSLARTGSEASGLVRMATAATFTGLLLVALGLPARARQAGSTADRA